MASGSTLDEIEADIRRCEEALACKGQLPSGRERTALPGVAALPQRCKGSATTDLPTKQQQTPVAAGMGGSVGRRTPPARSGALRAAPPHQPRNTADLLALLEEAPEGQPFEIDARLLYSPQPSVQGSGSTPSGASWRSSQAGASEEQQGSGRRFLLPAYRPSTQGAEPLVADLSAAAALLSPLQQHALAAPWATSPSRQSTPQGAEERDVFSPVESPTVLEPESSGRSLPWGPQQHASLLSPGSSELSYRVEAAGIKQRPGSASYAHEQPGAGGGKQPARRLELGHEPRGAQGSAAECPQKGREDRLHHLARPRTAHWQACAQQRAEEEQQQMAECTFAPRVGRPPEHPSHLQGGMPVEQRLLLSQQGKQQALVRARQQLEGAQLAECTFAPQLVGDPERHLRGEYRPIHQRLGQEQRRRGARLAQARVKEDLANAELTFQPKLNQRSLRLAAAKEGRELYEDLSGGGRRRHSAAAARGARAKQQQRDEDSSPSFAPAINAASRRLLADSAQLPSDFAARQRHFAQLREEHASATAAGVDSAAGLTFRPDTGNAVEVLALSSGRAGQLLETEQERWDRMAWEESAAAEARRAAAEREAYGSLQFRPQLNPRSMQLAQDHQGMETLVRRGERQRLKLLELRAAAAARQQAECTFQPDTSKPRVLGYWGLEHAPPVPAAKLSIAAAALEGFEGLTQRIHDYEADREARAAAAREQEQARRLRECTFAPDINRRLPAPAQSPVLVRGLERHMELRGLAERQQAEAAERAARVFLQHPQGLPPGQRATVPKPFRLAGQQLLEAKAAQKQVAVREEALNERLKECTFQPQTNAGKQRVLLQRLLAAPAYGTGAQLADTQC